MSLEFNRELEATAFAGEVRTEIRGLRSEMAELSGDVKHIRSTIDRWGGAVALISATLSVVVSVVVAALKQ